MTSSRRARSHTDAAGRRERLLRAEPVVGHADLVSRGISCHPNLGKACPSQIKSF